MGNFHQHVSWSTYTLLIIQSVIIYLLIQQIFPISFLKFDTAKSQLALLAVLLSIPFIFVIGAVSPDIDLPKDSMPTKLFYRYFLPLLFGLGVGIGVYRIVTSGVASAGFVTAGMNNIASLPFILAVSFGVIVAFIAFIGVWAIDKKSVHWGFCHSIFFSFILSGLVFVALLGIWGTQYILLVALQSVAYLTGYWNHLFCDQVYHEIRDKQWDNPRFALKLWSNNWNFDPFIILDKLTSEKPPARAHSKSHSHHNN